MSLKTHLNRNIGNYEYLDYEFPIDYDENEKLILYLIF